jgi:hypothetical protein
VAGSSNRQRRLSVSLHVQKMTLEAGRFRAVEFRTESRIKIASNVSEVWAYLCDVARWPEWAPTVLECRINGGAPLQPGAQVDQRAKGPFGTAFAGPLGTSSARWGMELEPMDNERTDAMMWIEVELRNVMRAIPRELFKSRIQHVSDIEMIAIKAAVESTTPARTS